MIAVKERLVREFESRVLGSVRGTMCVLREIRFGLEVVPGEYIVGDDLMQSLHEYQQAYDCLHMLAIRGGQLSLQDLKMARAATRCMLWTTAQIEMLGRAARARSSVHVLLEPMETELRETIRSLLVVRGIVFVLAMAGHVTSWRKGSRLSTEGEAR